MSFVELKTIASVFSKPEVLLQQSRGKYFPAKQEHSDLINR